jgi:hypothetical protein
MNALVAQIECTGIASEVMPVLLLPPGTFLDEL